MVKTAIIKVNNTSIGVTSYNDNDYICLTDMTKNFEGGSKLIEKWMNNKNTIEFLGVWEKLNNTNFNSPEFGGIYAATGSNKFYISVSKFIAQTNAVGIVAKTGRYGGTYAHKDIAYHFGMWLSPEFNLLVIKEFQRLKEIESNQYNLEWNVKRVLSKVNYQLQTDAIKNYILPNKDESMREEWVYADEADILNLIMFGCTAKRWRALNPERANAGENIRDMASINELNIISNLESFNATLIKQGVSKNKRIEVLSQTAKEQRELLDKYDYMKSIKKLDASTYIDVAKEK
jgi:hypothetical protein